MSTSSGNSIFIHNSPVPTLSSPAPASPSSSATPAPAILRNPSSPPANPLRLSPPPTPSVPQLVTEGPNTDLRAIDNHPGLSILCSKEDDDQTQNFASTSQPKVSPPTPLIRFSSSLVF